MKKIFFLNSPGNLNIGNEFINVGAKYLIKDILFELFGNSYELYESEFWQMNSSSSKNSWNTDEMIEKINSCDLVIVSGGSIVNPYAKAFLKEVSELKPPKVLLGASMYFYNEEERLIGKEILSRFDLVVSRDLPLYQVVKNNDNPSINGIEMAFFINDAYKAPQVEGKYAVVNIDFDILRRFKIFKKHRELKKEFSTVYVTENTSFVHKKKGFVFLSRWSEFCNLYINASFVSTMRIHTAVICMLYGVPFEYIGSEINKRDSLFQQFGMTLKSNKRYSREELLSFSEVIKKRKKETREELLIKIKSLLA